MSTRPIRFRVKSPEASAVYEMPRTDAGLPMLNGLPAEFLHGCTVCIQGYDPTPDAVYVAAYVPPLPKPETKRR